MHVQGVFYILSQGACIVIHRGVRLNSGIAHFSMSSRGTAYSTRSCEPFCIVY